MSPRRFARILLVALALLVPAPSSHAAVKPDRSDAWVPYLSDSRKGQQPLPDRMEEMPDSRWRMIAYPPYAGHKPRVKVVFSTEESADLADLVRQQLRATDRFTVLSATGDTTDADYIAEIALLELDPEKESRKINRPPESSHEEELVVGSANLARTVAFCRLVIRLVDARTQEQVARLTVDGTASASGRALGAGLVKGGISPGNDYSRYLKPLPIGKGKRAALTDAMEAALAKAAYFLALGLDNSLDNETGGSGPAPAMAAGSTSARATPDLSPIERPAWFTADSAAAARLRGNQLTTLLRPEPDPVAAHAADSLVDLMLVRCGADSSLRLLALLMKSTPMSTDSTLPVFLDDLRSRFVRRFPPGQPDRYRAVIRLARRMQLAGRDEQARQFIREEATAVREAFGPWSPRTATTELEQAAMFWGFDDRFRLDHATRASEIAERLDPTDTMLTFRCEIALGEVHRSAGNLALSRDHLERALALHQAAHGSDDALTITLLSSVYGSLEDEVRSQEMADRLESLGRSNGRPNGADSIRALINHQIPAGLGSLPMDTIRAWMASLEQSPFFGHVLLGASDSLALNRRFRDAIEVSSAAIRPSKRDRALWAFALYSRAEQYRMERDYTLATLDLQRALQLEDSSAISVGRLGQILLFRSSALDALARVHLDANAPDTAIAYSLAAHDCAQTLTGLHTAGLSESEALRAAGDPFLELGPALTILAQGDGSALLRGETFLHVARARGRVYEEAAQRARLRAARVRWQEQRDRAVERQSRSSIQDLRSGKETAWADSASFWRRERESADRRLASIDTEAEGLSRELVGSVRELSARLPARSVLVSFVRYAHVAPGVWIDWEEGLPTANSDSTARYLAFVLRPDEPAPSVVPLGSAIEADSLVKSWRRALNVSGGRAAADGERALRAAGEALGHAIWEPLGIDADSTGLVLLVNDGAFHDVSFAALPASDGRYLIEHPLSFHQLTTERELLAPRADRAAGPEALTLFGAMDYASDQRSRTAARPGRQPESSASGTVALRSALGDQCVEGLPATFPTLSGTRIEIDSVAAVWLERGPRRQPGAAVGRAAHASEVQIYAGPDASEGRFKRSAPSAAVLHLATHGFFAHDCPETTSSRPDTSAANILRGTSTRTPVVVSGLVFAGVNNERSGATDDGFLTSEEIQQLDLSKTRLVVLSACDTGLGDLQSGEGLLGLRRSFGIAGARSVVASMWKVSDNATAFWMTRFYAARFVRDLSLPEAVHAASRETFETLRERHESESPWRWAAFSSSGDWR